MDCVREVYSVWMVFDIFGLLLLCASLGKLWAEVETVCSL